MTARRPMLGALLAALVLVGTSAPGGAAARAGTAGPCPSMGAGVTIVVDRGALGGGVEVRCATGAPASGLDALQSAGFSYGFVPGKPGFVCTIDAAPDPCNGAPTSAYWAYHHAARGGAWTYATIGAGTRRPPVGSVEGWAFGDGDVPSTAPPAAPATAPPPPAPVPSPSPVPAPAPSPTPPGPSPTPPTPSPLPPPPPPSQGAAVPTTVSSPTTTTVSTAAGADASTTTSVLGAGAGGGDRADAADDAGDAGASASPDLGDGTPPVGDDPASVPPWMVGALLLVVAVVGATVARRRGHAAQEPST